MAVLFGWQYCPRCRSELEANLEEAGCPACGSRYYANSAPTVGALCEDELGRLMLVRRAVEPQKGKWDTPGGFLNEGEQPLDGLKRELREETGLEIEPVELLGVCTDVYGDGEAAPSIISLNWTCRVTSGVAQPADDVAEIRWFPADELPPEPEFAFPSVAEIVAKWRAAKPRRRWS